MPSLSRLLAALATLSLISLACVSAQKTDSNQQATSTIEELPNEGGETGGEQPAAAAGPQLTEVTAEEGFTVKMPGQPQVQRQKVNIPAGEVSTAAYSLQTAEGVIYSISTADYPEKVVASRPPEAFLNEGRDGLTNQLKGTVSNEQELTLDGYPGKSYTVSSPNGEVRARNYLVGPRLYTMLVLYNPSIGAPGAEDFLGSLGLVNPPPAIPRAGAAGADGGVGDGGTDADAGAVEATAPDAGPTDAGAPAPAKRRRAK
ncbi:hypothetical protein SAMN05443572_104419 [Myxococcus fulvus]|uniref:Lipoprotein n=1 Tax=Myxococcus fulvus TaxID=33 RepID=A0A511SZE7_MYXFU|nr:hypothetical protein [Myxococcus fulvus]AKF83866.1 hypothetical protein MFUL124B02_38500 [Myxococcus fulvus 124B02]GEN06957.1 hypothetical protein MFU01_19940 [Myxococcus fulvus]SEU02351.1 hypothetical protein SAMN05443572_104419 [Myxococcus fulvus]